MKKLLLYLDNFSRDYANEKLSFFKWLKLNLFTPWYYFIENIVFNHFWKKVILQELLTNDEIVFFFDKNEFSFVGDKLIKSDLLSENRYFDRLNLDEAKEIIKGEFIESINNLFNEHIAFDIENYITLFVTTDIKIITDKNDVIKEPIYTVELYFYRYIQLQYIKRLFKKWILKMMILTSIVLAICYYFHFIF
jgi:hypothetical protein